MWSLTLRLREAGMATPHHCIVATARAPLHAAWVQLGRRLPLSVYGKAVTAALRWMYKVASHSISLSRFYIKKCLCHKPLMDGGRHKSRLPKLFLFVLFGVFIEVAHAVPALTDSCPFTSSSLFPCWLPVIFSLSAHRFFLKFFLKCNQNCLKNAGNPRDMRRFQVKWK